jgi:hypothetical protein
MIHLKANVCEKLETGLPVRLLKADKQTINSGGCGCSLFWFIHAHDQPVPSPALLEKD